MRTSFAGGVFLALLAGVSSWQVKQAFKWPYPRLTELVFSASYMKDAGCLFLGARRLAGDLAYIQALQYYGQLADDKKKQDSYPHLIDYGKRILRLDPSFSGPVLELSGALAFNVGRVKEAKELLAEAMARNPRFYRYQMYLAAILYKDEGREKRLIQTLLEAIKYPDCPPLLEGILGNLLEKAGRSLDARNVYLHILQTAPKASDREDAGRRLERLFEHHPPLRFTGETSR